MKQRILHLSISLFLLVGLISIPFWIKIHYHTPENLDFLINTKPFKKSVKTDKQKLPQNISKIIKQNKDTANLSLSKKQKQAQFEFFLQNHPYSKRPHLSKQAWKKYPKKDRPDLAMEQDFLLTLDPTLGTIPSEAKQVAYEQTQASLITKAGIPINWIERGPDNIGGRTRAIMFDPNDATDKKVWAGGVFGGLWYNDDITDANSSWQHISSFWDNIAISAIAHDPSNTQVFYVGTGEGYYGGGFARGNGIWKTIDAGTTWTQLSSTNNNIDFRYVNDIEVTSTGVVIAGTRSGIQRSTDGGNTWIETHNDDIMDLEKSQSGDLYLGDSDGEIHKSTDNGLTWSVDIAPTGGDRVEIACAASNNNILYAISEGGTNNSDIVWFKKSVDGGTTWTDVTIPLNTNGGGGHFTRGQGWYDLILAVHPTNPNLVIAGGVDLHRTTNGGSTWAELTDWRPSPSAPHYAHADQHEILFRPNHPNQAIFGNDGGLSISTTVGDPTALPQTSGLIFATRVKDYNVTQFYSCAIQNENNQNYYLAGSQDNGTQQFQSVGINSTNEVTGGDGGYCFIDQDDANYQITSFTFNNYRRSTNGGASFSGIASDNSGAFINPTEYDSESNILYSNRGSSTQIKRISGISGTISQQNINLGLTMSSSSVTHLKASPHTSNRLFLGVGNGSIYRVDNANATPNTVEISTSPLPVASISCIEVGQHDDHLLVTFSNYGVVSVWETKDGGTTWTDKEGNLPNMPVRWAIYNPSNYDEVLLATEFGIWSTDDISETSVVWEASNTGLANVRCTMLKYRDVDKQVVVATYGRGLFTSDVFAGSHVSFEIDELDIIESTESSQDCLGYKDHIMNMKISSNPIGGVAQVTVETDVSTATESQDFEILTPMPLMFTPNGTTSLPFTIRVYDDVATEGTENIQLKYTLDAGTSNAIEASNNQVFVINLIDNDPAPNTLFTTFFTEDWNSGSFDTNDWAIDGENLTINANRANFIWFPQIDNYEQMLTSKVLDATQFTNVKMDYDFILANDNNTFECQMAVEYKKTSESTWTLLENFSNHALSGQVTETYHLIDQSLAVDNSEFQIRFRFYGENSFSLFAMAVDNIILKGNAPSEVASGIITVTGYVGAFQTVHFYDETKIIATIENLSDHDYGCTTVEIDRTGTSASIFYNTEAKGLVTDKTYKVTPTNPNTQGSYNITLYFTQDEIEGWENATGNSRNDLSILKSPESIASQTLAGSLYGLDATNNVYLTSNFLVTARFNTGFSGFAGCIFGTEGPLAEASVGLDNLFKEIKLYPNPTNHRITLETHKNIENIESKLLDMQGRVLLNFKGNLKDLETSINTKLKSMQAGTYLIYLKTLGKEGYLKFIKQ